MGISGVSTPRTPGAQIGQIGGYGRSHPWTSLKISLCRCHTSSTGEPDKERTESMPIGAAGTELGFYNNDFRCAKRTEKRSP